MKYLIFVFSFLPSVLLLSQEVVYDRVPSDIETEKVIFLKFDRIRVTNKNPKGGQEKYVVKRQTRHNDIIRGVNNKLIVAAMKYPFEYGFASLKNYISLVNAGYKYVLLSNVYDNQHLIGQPEEGDLLVFDYYLVDMENSIAYKVFQLDEMKVYDSKLVMHKFLHALKHQIKHH